MAFSGCWSIVPWSWRAGAELRALGFSGRSSPGAAPGLAFGASRLHPELSSCPRGACAGLHRCLRHLCPGGRGGKPLSGLFSACFFGSPLPERAQRAGSAGATGLGSRGALALGRPPWTEQGFLQDWGTVGRNPAPWLGFLLLSFPPCSKFLPGLLGAHSSLRAALAPIPGAGQRGGLLGAHHFSPLPSCHKSCSDLRGSPSRWRSLSILGCLQHGRLGWMGKPSRAIFPG